MNTLGVGANYFVVAGKTKVYMKALPQAMVSNKGNGDNASSGNGNVLELPDITFPSEWIDKDGHIECIAISNDDKIVAVADSMHGLSLFTLESTVNPEWHQIFSRVSNKRVIKMEFTSDRQYLTFLDKQGDIYAIHIPEDHSKISNMKKIMGHTSFLSDYVTRPESKQIVSCDRDEKIRISNFPDAYVIQGFKLGHTESVINVVFLERRDNTDAKNFLLSISLTGILMLWDFNKPVNGTETDSLKTWHIKELLPEGIKEAGVKLMTAVAVEENAHICVTFTGSTKIYIFQVSLTSFKIELLHELETDSENIVVEWSPSTNESSTLIVYTPDLGSIKYWQSGNNTLQSDKYDNLHETVISDMKASTDSLKGPVVPMKKRLTTFEDATALLQEQNAKKVKT